MFSVTFLGHQGWLFRSGTSCLLVDPLLCQEFGQAHALTYRVYPPRVFNIAALPKIDAVLISHEHDDHFDIPSLTKLDRCTPIYLSARSSIAASRILQQMGFSVHPLKPGERYSFGDLELLPLCGDHINTNNSDEWDALPFIVRQRDGAGSFFSMVDCTLTPGHLTLARAFIANPGIIGWTNNTLDWSHTNLGERASSSDETAKFTQQMLAAHYLLSDTWGTPAAMLLCAGGFSFYGDRAWLNNRVFCVDPERVCKAIRAAYPEQRFYATRPGQTFHMENNLIKKVDKQTPFLETPPVESWPSRQRSVHKDFPDYAPATGRHEINVEELALLEQRLTEFAQALVDSVLFRSLHSLLDSEVKDRIPSFVFSLRSGSSRSAWSFAYNANACTFDRVEEANPRARYLAGVECWASDLLAVLSGELGPIALIFGRAGFWNALPQRLQFGIFDAMFRVSHPLRRPAETLRMYERLLKNASAE